MPQTSGFTTLILFCIDETIQQILITEPQISTSQLNILHPVNSILTWVWVLCFLRDHYVFCSLYMSLHVLVSLLSFCPSVFPSLFPHPSVSLPRYSSSNTWTPLYCNLFQSLPFFLPKLSDGPLTPQIPASSPPSLLPLCPPWSGAKGLHPLPEGPLYRRW